MGPGTETVFLMIQILALQTVYLLALPVGKILIGFELLLLSSSIQLILIPSDDVTTCPV